MKPYLVRFTLMDVHWSEHDTAIVLAENEMEVATKLTDYLSVVCSNRNIHFNGPAPSCYSDSALYINSVEEFTDSVFARRYKKRHEW